MIKVYQDQNDVLSVGDLKKKLSEFDDKLKLCYHDDTFMLVEIADVRESRDGKLLIFDNVKKLEH